MGKKWALVGLPRHLSINISRPEQYRQHFADNNFKLVSLNGNCCNVFQILLKFVPKGTIDQKSVFVQTMAWCQTGNKPLQSRQVSLDISRSPICFAMGVLEISRVTLTNAYLCHMVSRSQNLPDKLVWSFKAISRFWHLTSQVQDFTRYYYKTSYHSMNFCPCLH